jgi:hypothetical protein
MVYLKTYISNIRSELMKGESLSSLSYCYASEISKVQSSPFHFTGEERIAAKGYLGEKIHSRKVEAILNKTPKKGFGLNENIYKLLGIYLATGTVLKDKINSKFQSSSTKNKYFIAKCLPEYWNELKSSIINIKRNSPFSILIAAIFGEQFNDKDLQSALHEFVSEANDAIDLLLLEDLEKFFLSQVVIKRKVINKAPKELICDILMEFREASKKVVGERRKDHNSFDVNDEYDVQDLLYTILKTIFPTLKEEDPTPRVGIKSNKIDLILRDHEILIEVKMIKKNDRNEKKFVEELKNDIQSYHQCPWLKYLICFVYDPFDKTTSKQNFYDLNGAQSFNGKSFEIEVIVG